MKTVYQIEWSNGNTDVFANRDEATQAYAIDLRMCVEEDGKYVSVDDATAPGSQCVWSAAALRLV